MKTNNYIQKIVAGVVFILLTTTNISAQFEYLVDVNPNRSVVYGQFLNYASSNEVYVYVQSIEYTSNNARWTDGQIANQKNLLKINTETGNLVSSNGFSMPYSGTSYFHAYGNVFAGFRGEKSNKSLASENINGMTVSGFTHCKKLVLGGIDTVTKLPTYFKEQSCDLERAFKMTYDNSKYYVIYKTSKIGVGGTDKIAMLELNQGMQLIQKHTYNINSWHVQNSPNDDGFIAFEETKPYLETPVGTSGSYLSESQNYYRMAKVTYDGTLSYLSSEFEIENIGAGMSVHDFISDGTSIFVYLEDNDDYTNNEIRKYDTSGTLLGTQVISSSLAYWQTTLGGLFFIGEQKYYDLTISTPIKIMGFDENFDISGSADVGFTSVGISSASINENDMTFIATGTTNMHYSDTLSRYNDKLYILEGDLLDFIVPAGGIANGSDSFYFPNPNSQEKAFLKFSTFSTELDETMKITFVDIQGKHFLANYKVVSKDMVQIETDGMPNGTYVGTVIKNGEVITSSKLVIKR